MEKITVFHDVGGIADLCVIECKRFDDKRGYLYEAYNDEEFIKNGLTAKFVQDNEVYSRRGVLRGFGVNIAVPQTKLIRVLSGKIFDVVIDLRPNSRTFMKSFGIELSAKNRKQLYIPERFGHAYLALEDSEILFKITSHFIPSDEIGFLWNSKAFKVDWPFTEDEMIFSDKDSSNPEFDIAMVIRK